MDEDYSKQIAQKIGNRLRTVRERRKLSKEALAEQAEMALTDYDCYEQAKDAISVDDLERLAAILRLPIGHFLETCILCGNES